MTSYQDARAAIGIIQANATLAASLAKNPKDKKRFEASAKFFQDINKTIKAHYAETVESREMIRRPY